VADPDQQVAAASAHMQRSAQFEGGLK